MLNSASAIEGVSWAGFDWLLIDGEHSPAELGDVLSHLCAMSATPTVPIVRIPEHDPVLFKRHLDIRARTVMVPMIKDGSVASTCQKLMAGLIAAATWGHKPCRFRNKVHVRRMAYHAAPY